MSQFENIESELKQVKSMPDWGRKQSDDWDSMTRFIYEKPSYRELIRKLKSLNQSKEFGRYALHRWYNVMSAYGVEEIFANLPTVIKNSDKYDKLVDFTIQGIPFDHKTTVFPKNFGKDIEYAKIHPEELIRWLYDQQSAQGRHHFGNRLFIVLHKSDGEHWKLRAELSLLKPIISDYIANFNAEKLHKFNFTNDTETLSDIIWFRS